MCMLHPERREKLSWNEGDQSEKVSLTVVDERSCIVALKLNTPTEHFDNTEEKFER